MIKSTDTCLAGLLGWLAWLPCLAGLYGWLGEPHGRELGEPSGATDVLSLKLLYKNPLGEPS